MSDEFESRLRKANDAFTAALARIRGGRAQASLFDGVVVQCYGAAMPIAQVAAVGVADARTLLVSVWDRQNTGAVEKALRESDLRVGIAVDGDKIRATLPPLSEERRRELGKIVGKEAEAARVSARNARRDALVEIKTARKEKEIGEDDARRRETEIQKHTDDSIRRIDAAAEQKRAELLSF